MSNRRASGLKMGGGEDLDSFIITVKTDNAGTSNSDQFTIPHQGAFSYNYDIETSDGQIITGANGTSYTITFPSAGTYDIKIKGIFPTILFIGTTDRRKLIDIKQWGNISWITFNASFRDCTNLGIVTSTDTPDLSLVTDFSSTFRGCWFTNSGSINFNDWDVSNITTVNQFLLDTDNLDVSFSNWQIENIRNFTNFARDIGMSTANYDATLIGWESRLQSIYSGGVGYPSGIYTPNFRGVKYTGGGSAETARTSLITNYGWSFTDGGAV